MSTTTKKRLYFTMVLHPLKGWTRVGKAFSSRETAKGWVSFARSAWRGCRTKVVSFTALFRDGKLTERSRLTLDKKFNMDAPL